MQTACKKMKTVSKSKKAFIAAFYTVSILIIASGVGFIVFCITSGINFKVLNVTMPGAIFGLLVAYLGIRYFMLVGKLKEELYQDSSVFSWSNFRRRKTVKNR